MVSSAIWKNMHITPAIFVTPMAKNSYMFCFFVLFLLEIAVPYWLSLLLFHILSQSESLNSQ